MNNSSLPNIENKKASLNQKFSSLTPQSVKKIKLQIDSLNNSIDSNRDLNPIKIQSNSNNFSTKPNQKNVINNKIISNTNRTINTNNNKEGTLNIANKFIETFGNINFINNNNNNNNLNIINDNPLNACQSINNKENNKLSSLNTSSIDSLDKPIQGNLANSNIIKKKKLLGKLIAPIDPNLYKIDMKEVIKKYDEIKQGNIRKLNKNDNLKLTSSFKDTSYKNLFNTIESSHDFGHKMHNETFNVEKNGSRNKQNEMNYYLESINNFKNKINENYSNYENIERYDNSVNDGYFNTISGDHLKNPNFQFIPNLNRSLNDDACNIDKIKYIESSQGANTLNRINQLNINSHKNQLKNFSDNNHISKDLHRNYIFNISNIDKYKELLNYKQNNLQISNKATNQIILPLKDTNKTNNFKDSLNVSLSEMDEKETSQIDENILYNNNYSNYVKETNEFSFKKYNSSSSIQYINEIAQVNDTNSINSKRSNEITESTNNNNMYLDIKNLLKSNKINKIKKQNNKESSQNEDSITYLENNEYCNLNEVPILNTNQNKIERYNNDKIIIERKNLNNQESIKFTDNKISDIPPYKNLNTNYINNSANVRNNPNIGSIIPEKLFNVIESIEKENKLIRLKLKEKSNSLNKNIQSSSCEKEPNENSSFRDKKNFNFSIYKHPNTNENILSHNNKNNGPNFIKLNNSSSLNNNSYCNLTTDNDENNKHNFKTSISNKSLNKNLIDTESNSNKKDSVQTNFNLNLNIKENVNNLNSNNKNLNFLDLNHSTSDDVENKKIEKKKIEILSFQDINIKNDINNNNNLNEEFDNNEIYNHKGVKNDNCLIDYESKFDAKNVFCIYCLKNANKPIILSNCKHELCVECAKEYISIVDYLKNYDINHIKCPKCKKKSFIKDKINFEGNIDYTWIALKTIGRISFQINKISYKFFILIK